MGKAISHPSGQIFLLWLGKIPKLLRGCFAVDRSDDKVSVGRSEQSLGHQNVCLAQEHCHRTNVDFSTDVKFRWSMQ